MKINSTAVWLLVIGHVLMIELSIYYRSFVPAMAIVGVDLIGIAVHLWNNWNVGVDKEGK